MKNTLLIFAGIITITLSCCTSRRYIYSASPANNPYFSKKGQSQLSALYSSSGGNRDASTDGYARGADLQGGYSISDHWALTAGYFNRNEKDVYDYYTSNTSLDSSIVTYKRNLLDLGAGYFFPLDQRKDIMLNIFAGLGFGKFSFDDIGKLNGANYNRYHNSSITKWFIQPAINFTTGPYFRAAVIFRSSFVHYGNIQTSYTASELRDFSLERINNRTLFFFEPGVNFQFGLPAYQWIKLDMSISGVSHNSENLLGVRSGNTSIGLSFDLSAKTKK
jgi:hypothetical protein